jgi:exopolysaccharide production protein ExoQ
MVTTVPASAQNESLRGATPLARFAVALVLVASFGLISSDWTMSRQFPKTQDLQFHKQEKVLQQRHDDASGKSAAGFLLLAAAGTIAATRRPLRPLRWTHPVVIVCLGFVLWCALSILWSPAPTLSLRKVAILLLFLTGTIGMARLIELRDLCWVVALSCASFLALGLLAEISLGAFHPGQADYRFCGTFHPNDQGLQCALLILAALGLLWQGTRHAWLVGSLLAAGCGGLLLTKSRTALSALACALVLGMLLHSRGRQRILLASSLTVLVCVGIVAYSFFPMGVVRSAESLASMGRTGNVDSLTGRIPLWQALLRDVGARPWLGYSYGGYWDADHIEHYSNMFKWQIPNAHNAYFDLVLSVGIVGLAFYTLCMLGAWFVSLANHERSGDAADLFACCLIAFSIVHGFAESKFPFPGMSSAFLFLTLFILTARSAVDPIETAATIPSRDSMSRRSPIGWRLLPKYEHELP